MLEGLHAAPQSKELAECAFNMYRLSNQLQSMLEKTSGAGGDCDEAKSVTTGTYNTQLAQRLRATLMDEALAKRALNLANHVVKWKDGL